MPPLTNPKCPVCGQRSCHHCHTCGADLSMHPHRPECVHAECCVACEGTGKNSKGGVCVPCQGTGVAK